jgi:xanthine dehydrogenase accessory factor
LKTQAPYVGLVASRKRAAAVLEELRRRGLGEADLERLKAPAGLDIGARRGDEIALSIMAEIVQLRRGVERLDWPAAEPAEVAQAAAETAVDPICGMTVTVAVAAHTYEHEDKTYYFCCGGCRSTFASDPGAHLQTAGPS